MADVTYKQYDTSPALEVKALANADGSYINMSGGSVKFMLRKTGQSTLSVSVTSTSTTLALSTGSTSTGYNVTYSWSTGELATVGSYEWELECTLATGKVITVPNNKYYTLDVIDDLG